MLRHLTIRNFAIVDALDLEFLPGFTALTGETGAGKSILIDALALAMGERADAAQVRAGSERAEISVTFTIERNPELREWLADQALEGEGDEVLLRRIVDAGGRSRAFVNGHVATLTQLREVGERLLDIHGQHAHQSLLRPDAQRKLLDEHAGLADAVKTVGLLWREWQRLARARAEQASNASARAAEREQLAWQVEELGKLAPVAGEWESIEGEHSRLSHAASLIEGTRAIVDSLSESEGAAEGALSASITRLRELAGYDKSLESTAELLESAHAQLAEAVQDLRRYADHVDLDPQRLREVESRIEALHGAARRLRITPVELPAFLERQKARLAELDMVSDLAALAAEEERAKSAYLEKAKALSAARKKAAAKFSKDVTAAMKELAMQGGGFQASLIPLEGGGVAGNENIEFAVSANAGFEPRPLAKVASGGELSRISLAIQVIASAASQVPTMIFDEVDSGIGGAVAEIVGRRLKALGTQRQVLCVTHLAQVAALANHQWTVSKSGTSTSTASKVTVLDDKSRVDEIARMLGGVEITATTRRHAAEMLRNR
jgi:DNA repair protein RecN (Recombination protein N)